MKAHALTQGGLAEKLNIDQGQVSRYLSEDTTQRSFPSDMVCIKMAGLAAPEDKKLWLQRAKVSSTDLKLLAAGLNVDEPTILDAFERGIMEIIANPQGDLETSLVALMRAAVKMRQSK